MGGAVGLSGDEGTRGGQSVPGGTWWKVELCVCGIPDSSVGKESICNAGDLHSIPASGISPGEGIGYPLRYSWASLVAQMVRNLPAM